MATDSTSDYAETNRGGFTITCILDTGDITVSTAYKPNGLKTTTVTPATTYYKGEMVSLSDDTANTYAATGGLVLVEKPVGTEDRLIGRILTEPEWVKQPSSTHTDGLADRLSNEYYMIADVWCPFFTGVMEGVLVADGSNAITPGSASLDLDASLSASGSIPYFKYVASGSAGYVCLHHQAAGTSGDTASALIALKGGFGSVVA